MILTVQDILPILLKQGTLAAGEQGLNRRVEYFDVLEQPDIKSWLRPHVLMVTTGYAVRNDKEALLTLIEMLQEVEAAGLVIKTRFFDAFPEDIIEYCKGIHFPLILLHDEVTFSDITYPLMEAIITAKNEVDVNFRFEMGEASRERHINLFTDLILEQYDKWEEMDCQINALHWPSLPAQMAVIKISSTEFTKLLQTDMTEQMYHSTRHYLSSKKRRAVVIPRNNECICLFSSHEEGETVERILGVLQKRLEHMVKQPVKVGVSDQIADYQAMPQTYEDVQDALRIGTVLKRSDVVSIHQERFEQVYLRMSREPFWKNVVKERLAKLEYYDCNKDLSLIQTVEVLLQHMGNRKAAAQTLFLHRNTMSYRVKKIESLTGMNLSEGENLIQLSIVLRIRKYL